MTKICLKCKFKYDDSFDFCDLCGMELAMFPNEEENFETLDMETKKTFETEIITFIKNDMQKKFLNEYISFSDVSEIKAISYKTIETQQIKNKTSTGKKVLATMVAGSLGYVATSGIKQENITRKIKIDGEYLHINVKISDKHIIYKTYSDNDSHRKFNKNKENITKIVINWPDIDYLDTENFLILKNGEALKFPKIDPSLIKNGIEQITNNPSLTIKFFDENYETIEKASMEFLIELINNKAKSVNETNTTNNSDLDELERIANLYEKGLLTDEEFAIMKNRIIQ